MHRTPACVYLGVAVLAVLACFPAVSSQPLRVAGRAVLVSTAEQPDALVFVPLGEQNSPAAGLTVASVVYVDAAHPAATSGFGQLRIEANNSDLPAVLRYRAAGFLEGYTTAERIWDHYTNTWAYFQNQLYPDVSFWQEPLQWLNQQEAWVREQIAGRAPDRSGSIKQAGEEDQRSGSGSQWHSSTKPDPPDVWSALEVLLAQFDGLVEGYAARYEHDYGSGGMAGASSGQARRFERMTRDQHLFLQSNGELYDIIDAWLAGNLDDDASSTSARAACTCASHTALGRTLTTSPGMCSTAGQSSCCCCKDLSPAQQGEPPAGVPSGLGARWQEPSRSPEQWLSDLAFPERCSALVKVTGDLSDLLVGHATWDSFTQMLRLYKHYSLGGPGFGRLSFSSYAGETFSDDDFYLSESGLVVLETTNHIFDPSVYGSGALTPRSLLSWQRVRAALMIASNGQEWVRTFSALNSGTYNNQYMIVNMNAFTPRKPLAPGLLWIAEQVPGEVVAADMTDVLARGYWGSYNVPFFSSIYNASGYPAAVARVQQDAASAEAGPGKHRYELPVRWLSYQVSPRASIFRRDSGQVDGMESFKDLMRYNNYLSDPYSAGHPLAAVCGRQDLPPAHHHQHHQHHPAHGSTPQAQAAHRSHRRRGRHLSAEGALSSHQQQQQQPPLSGVRAGRRNAADNIPIIPKGCYDGKVTNYQAALRLESEVVAGPTQSHGLPSFRWSDWEGEGYTHQGHFSGPWNFTWQRMSIHNSLLQMS